MEQKQSKAQNTVQEYLTFEVGGQSYAVPIATVREIRGWTEPNGMPDAPPHIMGVINLRGEVLPLLNLAARLGLQTPEIDARSVIIVVEYEDQTTGLLVDSVSNIIAPEEDEIKPPPETALEDSKQFVSALTLLDDKLIRMLNLSAVLTRTFVHLSEAS